MATNTSTDPSKFSNTVVGSVENPLTGEETELRINYSLGLASDYNSALSLEGGNDADIWFWYNHGRKVVARYLANQLLETDFGDDEVNNQFNQFKNARKNLVDKDTSEERLQAIVNFILSEPKFAKLRGRLQNLEFADKNVTFGTGQGEMELRKPTGVRGKPRKNKPEGDSDEGESEE